MPKDNSVPTMWTKITLPREKYVRSMERQLRDEGKALTIKRLQDALEEDSGIRPPTDYTRWLIKTYAH